MYRTSLNLDDLLLVTARNLAPRKIDDNTEVYSKQKIHERLINWKLIVTLRIYYLLNKYVTYVVVISQNLYSFQPLQKSFVRKSVWYFHFYRYQESYRCIYNYDDRLFLGIDVCLYLTEHLLNHNSISSVVDSYVRSVDSSIRMFATNIALLQLFDLWFS